MSTPRSQIKFYEIYDILPNYIHTRYFGSENDRDTYFDNMENARIIDSISKKYGIIIDLNLRIIFCLRFLFPIVKVYPVAAKNNGIAKRIILFSALKPV